LTWIDVHTQLPGINERCLFVVRGKVRCGELGVSDNGFRVYTGSEFDDAPLVFEVSHWMYLPEPPTSKQGESPSDSPASPVQHSQHEIPECNGGGCHVAYKCNNRRGSKQCEELRANG